jgi:hypothetical protein
LPSLRAITTEYRNNTFVLNCYFDKESIDDNDISAIEILLSEMDFDEEIIVNYKYFKENINQVYSEGKIWLYCRYEGYNVVNNFIKNNIDMFSKSLNVFELRIIFQQLLIGRIMDYTRIIRAAYDKDQKSLFLKCFTYEVDYISQKILLEELMLMFSDIVTVNYKELIIEQTNLSIFEIEPLPQSQIPCFLRYDTDIGFHNPI